MKMGKENTDATKSKIELSLEERFSALGSVVGKLSKCIDDRNRYIHTLEGQLKAAKESQTAALNELYVKIDNRLTSFEQKYFSQAPLEQRLPTPVEVEAAPPSIKPTIESKPCSRYSRLKSAFGYVNRGATSICSRLYSVGIGLAEVFEEEEDPLYNFGVKVWGRFKRNPK